MIPEGVYVITNASISKSKTFTTPVGVFDYTSLSYYRYSIGIDQKENAAGRFLIATPEKALADLIEARKMDEELLKSLSKMHLLEIAENYRSKSVTNLINVLGML